MDGEQIETSSKFRYLRCCKNNRLDSNMEIKAGIEINSSSKLSKHKNVISF